MSDDPKPPTDPKAAPPPAAKPAPADDPTFPRLVERPARKAPIINPVAMLARALESASNTSKPTSTLGRALAPTAVLFNAVRGALGFPKKKKAP